MFFYLRESFNSFLYPSHKWSVCVVCVLCVCGVGLADALTQVGVFFFKIIIIGYKKDPMKGSLTHLLHFIRRSL